jgi:RNA recognition motif-containing protein
LKLHQTEFGAGTIEVLRNAGQNKVPKTAEQKSEEKKVTGAYVVCIKDLPNTATPQKLNEHFAACGTVAKSRICKNGFALVKFADQEGADAALKLHSSDFSGRPIQVFEHVEKAAKEEAVVATGKAQGTGEGKAGKEHDNEFTIIVRKLPAVAEAKFREQLDTIRAHFKDCGQIRDLRLPRDETKTTKGLAFIKFARQEGYDKALQLNKKDCEGSILQVKPADKPMIVKDKGKGKGEASGVQTPEKVSNEKKRDADAALKEGSAQDEAPKKKIKMDPEAVKNIESAEMKAAAVDGAERHPEVVVKNLPFTVDMAGLILKFGGCGRIQKLQIETSESKRAKGIAFVKFFDEVGYQAAMKLNDTDYGGRSIFVGSAAETREKTGKGKGKDGKDSKGKGKAKEFEVFVAGLPFATTEEAFKQRFAEFGEIVNLRFPVSEEGKARGIAFIEYNDKEACDKALKLNEQDYAGRSLTVKMASDESRGKGKDGKGKGRDSKEKAGKASSENKTDAKATEKPASDSSD